MTTETDSAGILLTHGDQRSVLAACRGLHQAGFRVGVTAPGRGAPALWSRACDERLMSPYRTSQALEFVQTHVGFASSGRYALLMPGTDAALFAISKHRELLEPYVRLGLPPHTVVARAFDRVALAEAGRSAGLHTFEYSVCETVDEALAAGERFGYPVMAKPLHAIVDQDGQVLRSGSVLARDAGALYRLAPGFRGPFIVQVCEPGPVVSFAGLAAGGRLLGAVVSLYSRTWRPDAGNVAFSCTVEPPAELLERVSTLLRHIGWQGVFELESIRRPNGTLAPIDFNPRVYGSMALALRSGVNLPALWVEGLLGRELSPKVAPAGVHYRWEDADFRHLAWQLRRGRLRAALRPLRPQRNVAHAYFSVRDPAPFAFRVAELAAESAKRLAGRRRRLAGSAGMS